MTYPTKGVRNKVYPIEFARIIREIYRQCHKGNDNREIRHHYCEPCKNIEHHTLISSKDILDKNHPTGLICINCCAIFD